MAMAKIKSGRESDLAEALVLLRRIQNASKNSVKCWKSSGFQYFASKLSREDRQRFRRLARSAEATIWAAQCVEKCDSGEDGTDLVSKIEEVASELTEVEGKHDVVCKDKAGSIASGRIRLSQATLTSFHLAQAVTWNAWGTALQASANAKKSPEREGL